MNFNDLADVTLWDRKNGAYIVLMRDVMGIETAAFPTESEAKEHATDWPDDYLGIIHWTRVNGVDTMRSLDFDAVAAARERAAEIAAEEAAVEYERRQYNMSRGI